jgi:hypothetical protein
VRLRTDHVYRKRAIEKLETNTRLWKKKKRKKKPGTHLSIKIVLKNCFEPRLIRPHTQHNQNMCLKFITPEMPSVEKITFFVEYNILFRQFFADQRIPDGIFRSEKNCPSGIWKIPPETSCIKIYYLSYSEHTFFPFERSSG